MDAATAKPVAAAPLEEEALLAREERAPLAERPPLEDRYAEARDTLLVEFGAGWVAKKPWVLGLHKVAMGAVLLLSGHDATRTWVVLALWLATFGLDVVEARLLRPGPGADIRIATSTGFGMFASAVSCALTGGVHSPILPALLLAVVIPAAAFGNRTPTYALLAELVVLTATLALLPDWIVGPQLPLGYYEAAYVFTIVFAGWVSVTHLVALTEVYAVAAVMMARMRDEALALHESRARSLESMGAKVAHEIKNPLAAIAGLVQLLGRGEHDDKTRERLGVIASEVGRIERVVRDYLAFSRPLEVARPAPTSLAEIADDVVALLDARAEKRGILLRREGEGTAAADAQRLKEALLNVVDNAIEASPGGTEVRITVEVRGGTASFRVSDSGPSIPPDVLARIGTPYFTTKPEGTGLGVVLARAVLAQHGGTLAVSRGSGGTEVTLAWPASVPGCCATEEAKP